MWVSESNKDILEDIGHINSRKKAESIQTFDFSTLYTKIDLEDLKEILIEMLDKAFSGGQCKYTKITKTGATFDKGKKGGLTLTKEDCAKMISYIIDNAYFSVGERCYRQVIGIPMGTDPAPYIANLYLHHYEAKWLKDLAKKDYKKARRLGRTRRFIDDLATLNGDNIIRDNWKNIYPKQLILNKENEDDKSGSFLDLDIQIKDKKFTTKIYDKRDAFKFKIISYPDLSGNIAPGPAYGIVIGQILRIARNTSEVENFMSRTKDLLAKLYNKGYDKKRLQKKIKVTFSRYDFIVKKYDTTLNDLHGKCSDI